MPQGSPAPPPLSRQCFVATSLGLEPWLAQELTTLGLQPEPAEGGALVTLDLQNVPWLLANLRVASRVYVRVAHAQVRDARDLQQLVESLPWTLWPGRAEIQVRWAAKQTSSQRAGWLAHETARQLVAFQSLQPGTLTLLARAIGNDVEFSVDASGRPMHQRGWRLEQGEAPLRETVAAALLHAVGYQRHLSLWDPMTGSGTLAIEAATWGLPLHFRPWDADLWTLPADLVKNRNVHEIAQKPQLQGMILAGDGDPVMIDLAQRNAERAQVTQQIRFAHAELAQQWSGKPPDCVVLNPPWGRRLGGRNAMRRLFQRIGAVLQRDAPGSQLAILVPEPQLIADLPLVKSTSSRIDCGGVPMHLVSGTVTNTRKS